MLNEEEFDKKISLKFIQTLNLHLPARKRTLKELLSEDKPKVKTKDNRTHFFDKKELERLASLIPEEEHGKLRLPIYLEMSTSMERGAVRVSGRLECTVIKKILGIEREGDSITVYYPHLAKIRKELPTTTQYMFTMG